MSVWGYVFLTIALLCAIGIALLDKAINAGNCQLPDDDGEEYP